MIKLHDSERRLSGRPTDSGLPRVKGKDLDDIGLGMCIGIFLMLLQSLSELFKDILRLKGEDI